jgi:hypothetical protein
MPPKILTTQTQESGGQVVIDKLKPMAEVHVLVGGPYTAGGEEHIYGHTAVRVKVVGSDRVYDFGRYGRVVGNLGAEGEGILRVWSSFADYIAGENALRRKTTGFMYAVFDGQAQSANAFFLALIKAGKPRTDLARGRSSLTVYQLTSNYHALHYNCTTLSLDGVRAAMPTFETGAGAFIKPEDVLPFGEQVAMRTVGGGTPSRLFLPENLEQYLLKKPAVKPARIDVYGAGK